MKHPTTRSLLPMVLVAILLAAAACADTGGATPSGDGGEGLVGGQADPGLERPAVDGPVGEAVREACTPEKSETVAAIQSRGTLNWATGIFPPFGFRTSGGDLDGIEIDNAKELAHILGGVEVKATDYDYALLPPVLQSGKADIIGASLYITPDRAQAIDFSNPYNTAGQLFFVLEDSSWQSVDDLDNSSNRFIYGTGNAYVDLAKKLIPNAKIQNAAMNGQVLLYDFLNTNRADSTMVEGYFLPVLTSKYPNLAAIGARGRVTAERPAAEDLLEPFDVAFGLPKGDAGWKACVDAWVDDLTGSGRIDARMDYWLAKLND